MEVCPSGPETQGTLPGKGFGADKGGPARRDGGTSRALSSGGKGGGEIGGGGCRIKAPEKKHDPGPTPPKEQGSNRACRHSRGNLLSGKPTQTDSSSCRGTQVNTFV